MRMAAAKVLADFKADREQLEDAIVALEELARTKPRRRRPPAWMIEVLNPPRGSGPRPRTPAGARRYGLDVALCSRT